MRLYAREYTRRTERPALSRFLSALRVSVLLDGGEEASHGPLDRREMEVLALLEGYTDKDIAKALNLSYEGVRTRIRRIFAKLGAHGRLDAVDRARALRILPPGENEAQPDS